MFAFIRSSSRAIAVCLSVSMTACGEVTHPPTTGTIEVVVRTYGGDLDRSYGFTVGNQVKYNRGDGTVAFTVTYGSHTVSISEVAANCSVAGSTSVDVEVPRGKLVQAVFIVDCDATGLEISTRTRGTETPNFYGLKIGSSVSSIHLNETRVVSPLLPGDHIVEVELPGENCSAVGANPAKVSVTHRIVTPVLFEIECVAPVRRERLAFHAVVSTSAFEPNEIFVANPDGAGAVRIAFGESPSWSPDGRKLAYAATLCDWYYGCSHSLGIIDPETRAFERYAVDQHIETPAWSPDGESIAYVQFSSGLLFIIPSRGGLPERFRIEGVSRVRDPAWAPDGEKIAFGCTVAAPDSDICIVNRDGSGLVRLVQRPSVESKPAWSPDGSTIAFAVGPASDIPGEIALVPAAGGDVTTITQGSDPSWSKDGRKLIFSRADGLYTINRDATELTRITSGKHRAPVWRP
jgi:hypothetical protein